MNGSPAIPAASSRMSVQSASLTSAKNRQASIPGPQATGRPLLKHWCCASSGVMLGRSECHPLLVLLERHHDLQGRCSCSTIAPGAQLRSRSSHTGMRAHTRRGMGLVWTRQSFSDMYASGRKYSAYAMPWCASIMAMEAFSQPFFWNLETTPYTLPAQHHGKVRMLTCDASKSMQHISQVYG